MIFMPKPWWARCATARAMRPMPTRPSVLPVTWVPSMWVGRQPVHWPPAQVALAFAGAARDHQEERHREVGRGVGQHVGRVGDRDAAGLGRLDVDVVEAHAEVRHELGAARLRRQHIGRDLVGHGA